MSESLSVNDAKKMRSVELRQELAARNLDTTGTKPRLLTRLLESLEFTAVREDLATQAAEQNLPQATAAPSLRDIIREEVRAALGNQAAAPVPPAAHAAAPPPPAHTAALPRQAPATPQDALPAPHLAAAVSPPMNPAGKRTFYATVPKAIHDKVVTGQFVELGSLLPNPSQGDTSRSILQIDHDSSQGAVVLAPANRPSRKVEDIDTWLDAWTTYCAIYATAHPSRAPELFAYQQIILKVARKFRFEAVQEYDRSFRSLLAADPTMRWDAIVQDLYTIIFDARAFRPFRPTVSNDARSFRPNSSNDARSFRPSSGNDTVDKEVCRLFNQGKCVRSNCRFAHSCLSCGRLGHGQSTCSAGQPRSSN